MARPKKNRTNKTAAPAAASTAALKFFEPVAEAPAAPVKETKTADTKKAASSKKEAVKRADVFLIQSSGKDYTMSDIIELCKAAYRNGTRKQVKSCDVYLKVENGGLRAYYVINGKADGAFIDL